MLFFALSLVAVRANAQIYTYPILAKQMSTSFATGTARMQGMGGSFSVLGADLSSIAANPAGLGFYSKSEVGLTAAYQMTQTDASYLGESTRTGNSLLHVPNFGLVLASSLRNPDWHGAFGLSYSRQVILAQQFTVQGRNNRSSYLDRLIQNAADKGATGSSLDDEYDPNFNSANSPEAVAYQAYLLNPNPVSGGAPFTRFFPNAPTEQFGQSLSEGAVSQWDFSYGASYKDRFYIGAGVHFSRMNVTNSQLWSEEFIGNTNVAGYSYEEKLITSGSGLSATLGMIYKWNTNVRISFAVQSPTYYDQVSEQFTGKLTPQVSAIPAFNSAGNPIIITRVNPVKLTPNEFAYQLTTPLKLSGGLAYFFGKRGLISIDVDYLNYPGMRVASAELGPFANQQFQDKYNGQIDKFFQSAINVKVGGELRLSPQLSIRAGAASFGNGYAASYDAIDRSQFQLSTGLGYKTNDYYIDLAFIQRMGKDAYTPYTLKNATDYASAALDIKTTQISLGAGVYF